jgi:hypothetical protein
MSEWWTYGVEDLLLFAPRTYWRLIELHNQAVWPLHLAAILLAAGILFLVVRPRRWSGLAISALLALAWASVAWSFLSGSYAAINWAARYAAALFFLQAVLFVGLGVWRGRLSFGAAAGVSRAAGIALYVYAVALHPLAAVLAGRPLAAAEVVAIAPDPTAIATLGLLVTLPRGGGAFGMSLVPITWCLFSGVTLLLFPAGEGFIMIAAAGLSLLLVLARRWSTR